MKRQNPSMENTPTSADDQKPDWTIGELYQKAWELVKKHKVLWIYGMAAAGGASFNLRGLDSIDQETIQKLIPPPVQEATTSGTISYVLGAATSAPFSEKLTSIFMAIPIWMYGLLIAEFIFMVIFLSVVSYIYKVWSEAALLHAADEGLHNQAPTIESVSPKAFPAIKPLLWLNIIPMLILMGVSIVAFALITIAITVGSTVIKLIGGLALVIAIGAFVYWLIYLLLSSIWASRIIVLKKLSGPKALKQGYLLTKKKFWAMILLGLVNTIMSFFVVGVPIAIMAGLFIGSVFSYLSLPSIGLILAIIGGMVFLSFILGFTLLSGILTAFKAIVWSKAYKNIERKNYHENKF